MNLVLLAGRMSDDKGYSDSSFEAEADSMSLSTSLVAHKKSALHCDVDQWTVQQAWRATLSINHYFA